MSNKSNWNELTKAPDKNLGADLSLSEKRPRGSHKGGARSNPRGLMENQKPVYNNNLPQKTSPEQSPLRIARTTTEDDVPGLGESLT